MRLLAAALCLALAALPAAHAQKKNCEMQAGDPSSPSYDANLKACQGKSAPAARRPASKASAKQQSCEMRAGDRSSPTYEAVLKDCQRKAGGRG